MPSKESEKDSKLKKLCSYTYWKRDTDLKRSPAPPPEKIVDPTPSLTKTISKFGKSAWNSANTWEEKDVSKDLSSKVGGYLALYFESRGLPVTDVETDELKASICIVRGKPRLGFEMNLSASIKEGGFFKCQEFCDYDSTFELRVTDADGSQVKQILSSFRADLARIYMEDS